MKKLLALVLAMVMTLGLATVSSSAAYSDAADVSLEEAVDVMSAVGVFQGADGKFSPKANLNREQAAKLIAYLDLGESTAEALPAVKVFDDVPATSWSAKYIAYCADAGYIVGDGTGKFNPTGELNGYAFGKMVLCVLGYDADIEGFVGSNWSIAVAKLMEKNDIADGVSGAASATLTREQAAQYCLNALKADMVEYDTKGTSIDINGAKIATGASKAESVVDKSTVTAHKAIKDENPTNDDAKVTTVQLGEKLYNGKLELDTDGDDKLARPATVWTYDNDKVGTYADAADATVTVTAAGKTLAHWVETASKNYELDVDHDHADENAAAAANDTEITRVFLNGDSVTTLATKKAKANLNGGETEALEDAVALVGDTIELYMTDGNSKRVDKVIVTRVSFAEIDEVDSKLSSSQTKKGSAYALTLTGADAFGGKTYFDATDDDDQLTIPGFDAATYTEDAYLGVVYNAAGEILDSYVLTKVSGVVTSYKNAEYVNIDGTKYTYAETQPTGSIKTGFDFKNSSDIYLSANGYILFCEATTVAALEDIYYVTGIWCEASKGTTTYYANAVGLDGVIVDLKLESYEATNDSGAFKGKLPGNASQVNDAGKGLYVAKDNAVSGKGKANNDKYNFTALAADGTYGDYTIKVANTNASADVTAKSTYITVEGTRYYFNSDTSFIGVTVASSKLADKTVTAKGNMKLDVSVGGPKTFIITKTSDTKLATNIFYVATDLSTSGVANDNKDVVYVKSAPSELTNDGYNTTMYFMADNSEATYVATVAGQKNAAEDGTFYTFSVEDGIYDLATLAKLSTDCDDDTYGWYEDVNFVKDNLYMQKVTNGHLDEVSYADAKVIDLRDSDTIDADLYTYEITTVSTLESAAKKAADAHKGLLADVYVSDGKITFIAVTGFAD